MRRFEDDEGRSWEVVVGRESWGAFFAIFVPRSDVNDREVRQTRLEADRGTEAERRLDALDADGLRALLEESEPKQTG